MAAASRADHDVQANREKPKSLQIPRSLQVIESAPKGKRSWCRIIVDDRGPLALCSGFSTGFLTIFSLRHHELNNSNLLDQNPYFAFNQVNLSNMGKMYCADSWLALGLTFFRHR